MGHRNLIFILLSGGSLLAQDAYFKEPTRKWWLPTWELNGWHEDIDLGPGRPATIRDRSRLRLRWQIGEDDSWIQFRVGSAHYAGSDGNRFNLARFDNEPSNGSRLDLAELRIQGIGAKGGAEIHGGLVENGLISTESLWDPDLRVIGGFGRAFFRSPEELFDEIGIRATPIATPRTRVVNSRFSWAAEPESGLPKSAGFARSWRLVPNWPASMETSGGSTPMPMAAAISQPFPCLGNGSSNTAS